MSPVTELEDRLTAALAARAQQVRPEHLCASTVPVEPPRPRTPLLILAVAACTVLAVIVTLTLSQGERRVAPAPQPRDPLVVIPPDVGADWTRAKASTPALLDLDGDGRDERVRFLAEPTKQYDGRVRLETTLTGDGSTAYGLVDVGTTIGLSPLDPIDADDDGDQELVLYYDDPQDAMTQFPKVLDLRDGVLVEAPPADPELFRRGGLEVEGGTEHYDMVDLVDYWIDDGILSSARSRSSFAAAGMSLLRPEEYETDAYVWVLEEGGVLRPSPAEEPCVRFVPEGRRACRAGEADALPVVAPVVDSRIGIGEDFSATGSYRFDVRLDAAADPGADADVVVTAGDGRVLRAPLRIGAEPRVFTTQPTGVFYDGVSLVAATEDGDEPSGMQVLVEDGDRLVVQEVVGDVPLGTGYTGEGGRAFRTWLQRDGELLTAVAETDDEAGPWRLHSWLMVAKGRIAGVPRGIFCFADPTDPSTIRHC